jgi:3'-phosphoadenosine 5'-phosphosulfate sulfotransferase (PAPS reductase)/FAD synthetase
METGTKYIVNLSGGKDSTAMLLMLLEKECPIDYIIFADTGKDFPQMHDHLCKLAEYIKTHHPTAPTITILKADKSFDYLMFEHIKTKGKRKGSAGYGWATMLARWCTAALKTAVIAKFCREVVNDNYMHYIGIASDEPERLKPDIHKTYPLADWGITEAAALAYCYERGFDWGGLYQHFDRVSCWCCPLKNLKELRTLWRYYPELWAELKRMDERAYNQFRADYSVAELEEKFKQEDVSKSKKLTPKSPQADGVKNKQGE